VTPALGDENKNERLRELLGQAQGSGIIYMATVKKVEEGANLLRGQGFKVGAYHGRMARKSRTGMQDMFMGGELRVMVATNAFGLGIDKPDVRFVVHYHVPATIEALYQEFGRAGRDGNPAACELLYDPADRKLLRFFQSGRYPDESDLVNAYHAIAQLHGRSKNSTLAELQAASPLPKSKMKVCLELFLNRRILKRGPRQHFQLVQTDLSRESLVRTALMYRERNERDLIKQQQVVDYVESGRCRWRTLLEYFSDSMELAGNQCGHCDRCPSGSALVFSTASAHSA
jgi:ATP-dependent DNA helicase RecQ